MAAKAAKTHNDYMREVEAQVDYATDPQSWAMPAGKGHMPYTLQRFALTRMAYNKAKKLYDDQRANILRLARHSGEAGKHIIADTPQVLCTLEVTAPQMRLSDALVVDMLMDRLDIDATEAEALLAKCKAPTDPVIKLHVTLKK